MLTGSNNLAKTFPAVGRGVARVVVRVNPVVKERSGSCSCFGVLKRDAPCLFNERVSCRQIGGI